MKKNLKGYHKRTIVEITGFSYEHIDKCTRGTRQNSVIEKATDQYLSAISKLTKAFHKKNLLVLLTIVTCLSSCMSNIMDDDFQEIDPLLMPYVTSFVKEASDRGIEVDISTLKMYFYKLDGAAGDANHNYNIIRIDSTTVNWKVNPEEVVYHEFGHLLLHRGHDDSKLLDENNKEVPKTLMSTTASRKYKNHFDRRQYYIDELFNSNTALPEWVK